VNHPHENNVHLSFEKRSEDEFCIFDLGSLYSYD